MNPEFIKAGCYLFFGLLLKIGWDWLYTGRLTPGIYMTIATCEKSRAMCGPALFKQDFSVYRAKVDQKLLTFEKDLDKGSEAFKTMAGDISVIKTDLAVLTALVSKYFKTKETESSGGSYD